MAPVPRCPDTGQFCTSYCNPVTTLCERPPGTPCPTEHFCLGNYSCREGGVCSPNFVLPCSTDPTSCLRSCQEDPVDPSTGNCLTPYGYSCNDGIFCNGPDYCSGSGVCNHPSPPCDSVSIQDCNRQCNESTTRCEFSPVASYCPQNGIFCDGTESCDGLGNCVSSGDPCAPLSTSEFTEVCQPSDNSCQRNLINQNDQTASGSSSSVPVGAVVGGLLAALVCCGLLVAGLVLWTRRRQRAQLVELGIELPGGAQSRRSQRELRREALLAGINTLTNVKVEHRLGGGNFGEVFYGVWNGETPVALKRLKDQAQMKDFMAEAAMLSQLSHPNCVQLLGFYNDPLTGDRFIVTEYLSKGSLLTVLKNEPDEINLPAQLKIIAQCAAGMVYLQSKGIIHRDLAARNVLLTSIDGRFVAKIADFGLSRESNNYYQADAGEVPVRWSPPEVYRDLRYSMKSDVWSFGVLMWEVFELGAMPFHYYNNKETSEAVDRGERLAKPATCPDPVWQMMLRCWSVEAELRPTFQEILQLIQSEYSKVAPKKVADPPDGSFRGRSRTIIEGVEGYEDFYNTDAGSFYNNAYKP